MEGKKGRKLLKDCVDEMEECGPATSFGEAYGKQLELEEVRVETERSREQRENTQYLITMYQGLIAEATTPQEKSEYQAEVLLLMKQAVMHAKLKAHVASAHPCMHTCPCSCYQLLNDNSINCLENTIQGIAFFPCARACRLVLVLFFGRGWVIFLGVGDPKKIAFERKTI
jgi:hypothetical protein